MKKIKLIILYIIIVLINQTYCRFGGIPSLSEFTFSVYFDLSIIASMIISLFYLYFIVVLIPKLINEFKGGNREYRLILMVMFIVALLIKVSEYIARAK